MSLSTVRVAIDGDDTATELKKAILEHLLRRGVSVVDLNYLGRKNALYPEIAYYLAQEIRNKTFDLGVLICGTGLGMAITVNKVEGVYAGVCHDVYSAERLRKSNNAQVLTLGARVIGTELAKRVVDAFVDSEFLGGESAPKIGRLKELEKQSFHGS